LLKKLRSRLLPLLIPAVVLIVLIHEVITTPVYSTRELAAMREAAVALADQGEFDDALQRLRAMSEVAHKDRGVWGDYLVVLIRAGRADEALQLAMAAPQRELPDYALAALFAAALQRHDIALAEQFAAREVAQSADAAAVSAARANTLAAMRVINAPQPDVVVAPEPEIAAADAPVSTALNAQVADQQPASKTSRSKRLSNVAGKYPSRPLVQSDAAASQSSNRASEPQRLQEDAAIAVAMPAITAADRARAAVRAAEAAPPADRVARAYDALHALDKWEQELLAAQTGGTELRNARLDRVRALTLANRIDDAAELFAAIDSPEMPRYGLLHGADVYSRKREPERAAVLLDRAAQLDAGAHDLLVARFYNQLDLEQYQEADQTLSQLRDQATTTEDQRDIRVLSAMFAAYQNRLDVAQRELEQLQSEAPDDADVAMRLAQVYRWHGWPRQALAAYQAVAPRAADPVAAQVGAVASMVDAHRFAESRAALNNLDANTPRHPDVEGARADQFKRQRADYSAQITTGESSANSVNGNSDLAFEQRIYSAPLADQYRVFAHQRYDRADFPEDAGSANRVGVGADYRSQAFDAAVEITHRLPGKELGSEFGVNISGEWHLGDTWSVFGDVQTDSTAVPLRALRNGIDGQSASIGTRYRANENTEARVVVSHAEFSAEEAGANASSGDNDRDAVAANVRHAVYHSAHHEIAIGANAYYANNSAGSDVPYFNPDSEYSYGGTLEYAGILSRRFDSSWSHRVVFGLGEYVQQDYSATPIWDVEYQQRWRINDAFSINGGVLYRSRVYDGDREGYRAFYTGVNWAF
jgi:biofilm PGA synthesis protein PgaA